MRPLVILVVIALVCSAAGGGVAYAYATSVVPGLDRVDSVEAITAMRGIISEAASNPLFLLLLIGSAVVAVVVGTIAVTRLRQPGSGYLLAAALFTLVAGIVTVAFNVPLNKKLNAVEPVGLSAADAARVAGIRRPVGGVERCPVRLGAGWRGVLRRRANGPSSAA
jgi:uncharacterized membrane protein